MALLTWQALVPSQARLVFYNEGLDVLVSLHLPRMCVCVDWWKTPLLLLTSVSSSNTDTDLSVLWQFTSLSPWNAFTDSAGDAVRTLCGLVGSGGAAVWDALWTRPLWGWEWRRPLRVHPQWRGSLRVLAQHRGCKHTQSSKSFSFSAQSEESLPFRSNDLIAFFLSYFSLLIQLHEFFITIKEHDLASISICINLNPWINSGGQRSRESPSPPPLDIVSCPSGCAEWLAARLSSVSQLFGLALLYNYIKAWSAAQPQHTGYKYYINLSLQCLHPLARLILVQGLTLLRRHRANLHSWFVSKLSVSHVT